MGGSTHSASEELATVTPFPPRLSEQGESQLTGSDPYGNGCIFVLAMEPAEYNVGLKLVLV